MISRPIADFYSERWRAEEFGFAASAAGGPFSGLVSAVETPVLYIGDCGVAAGPVMAALALSDPPERGHPNNGPTVMISASSRSHERAALMLERFNIHVEEPS